MHKCINKAEGESPDHLLPLGQIHLLLYSKDIDFIKLCADKYSIHKHLLSSLALITNGTEGQQDPLC